MRSQTIIFIVFFLINLPGFCLENINAAKKGEMIYIGTFSEHGSLGIYVYGYDRKADSYDLKQTIISKKSPSFIEVSPNGKLLFSVNRGGLEGKQEWGSITSFAIDQNTGKLSILKNQFSYGESPCHVSIHPSGDFIFVSHYESGNFVVLPVDAVGNIGEPTANIQLEGSGAVMPLQERPHTHSVVPSKDGKFLYVSDLGLDKIFIYAFDEATGKVEPAAQPYVKTMPGAGPRHLALNPGGGVAFSAEEISSSICSYKIDKKSGGLQFVQRLSAMPQAFFGDNSSADVHVSSDGKFVYISNRGYNGMAMFRVEGNGKMINIGFMPSIGERPRNFLLDPKGSFMLIGNRDSDEINIFIVGKDGRLTDTRGYLPVPSPVCIKYLQFQ